MALSVGSRLGPYEIESSLGAGGMGEVYKARDRRLDRVVAVKVLSGQVVADSQMRERFEREARAISTLSHPHICALYDLGTQDGIDFLVLEYLDGQTLADRIAQGRVPLPEALRIAGQIAGALGAAHDTGIVHRDLKPDNVKLTANGSVKVLDFGLAKMTAAATAGLDQSNSPTMMATTPGVILGTASYMSPEQIGGVEVERTSDMWAFGCVLFEMLTGRRPFEGAAMSEILANVLKTEPDWSRLPAETPEGIRRLLRRCLQKDPALRLRDMRDARLEIDEAQGASGGKDRVSRGGSGHRERLAWASALALVALIAGLIGVRALRPPPGAPEVRLDINTPPTRIASLALSPDGLKVVFVARSDGPSRLWLRLLDSPVPRALPGTENARAPFWSPDGRSIGFFAGGKLKRMDIDGGSPMTLAGAGVPLGGAWSHDGTILFSNSPASPILRIPANGGEPKPVTRITSTEQRGHAFPKLLPDGQHFLFFALGSPENRGVYLGQIGDLKTTRLFGSDGPGVYASSGHLLFVREGKLLAQGFNPDRLELRGDPFPIAEGLTNGTTVSVSEAGPIAYQTPPADSGHRQLVWTDRAGVETGKVVYPDTAALGPSLSPDGARIAVYREANGNMDIWSYETGRRAWDRITFDPGDDIYPLWSRDGASLVFGAVRTTSGIVDLYRRRFSAPQGSEELLFASSDGKFPVDLSQDGRFLLFDNIDPKRGSDIWVLPLDGTRTPSAILQTDFTEGQAQFSPDSRWIAYQSDKTGRFEIYLRPFPGPGDDVRVSIDGGSQVRWNPKGEELFYIGSDDRLMAVSFHSSGAKADPGVPRALFATNIGSTVNLAYRQQYVVAPDGQSFILNSAVTEGTASPITVIVNWKPKRP